LLAPCVVLAAQWHPSLRDTEGRSSRTGLRLGLRVTALIGFVVALGVPVAGADRLVVVAVAVAIGLLLTALAVTGSDGDPGRTPAGWGDLFTWTGRAVLPMLFWLVTPACG